LHHYDVYGLIDRDYRSDAEINKLETDNIYVINVAEIENLFLVEELIKLIASHMQKDPDKIFSKIQNYVVNDRFKAQMDKQINQSAISEIKYYLTQLDLSSKNDINIVYEEMPTKFKAITELQKRIFQRAFSEGYSSVLKVFNEKGIVKSIGQYLGIKMLNIVHS